MYVCMYVRTVCINIYLIKNCELLELYKKNLNKLSPPHMAKLRVIYKEKEAWPPL